MERISSHGQRAAEHASQADIDLDLPHLSRLNDRYGELASALPLVSLFKMLLDPVVVVATYLGLCSYFDIALDGFALVFCTLVFLLSALLLEGAYLFVPGDKRRLQGLGRFALGWGLIAGSLGLIGYATVLGDYYYQPLIHTWMWLTPALLLLMHGLCRLLLMRALVAARKPLRTVVVGANHPGHMLAKALRQSSLQPYDFLGFFDDRHVDRLALREDDVLLGSVRDLPAYAREHGIHNIYVSLPMTSQQRVMELLDELKDSTASIYFVPDLFTFDLIQARFDHVQGIPVVAICESPFTGMNAVVKRLSDMVMAAAILLLIWPLLLGVAIAVKATSKGPVFFKQRRYGMNGESVLVYKFRSMTVMEDGDKVVQATRNDQRLTPIGSFLRKTSLDELPQFINVLEGKMSIVGPRPHANAHNEQYRKLIKGYMVRHKVRPGITGWAQVNGYRGETDTLDKMANRISYDLDYLRNWSIWLDLKIIIKTALMVVLPPKTAY